MNKVAKVGLHWKPKIWSVRQIRYSAYHRLYHFDIDFVRLNDIQTLDNFRYFWYVRHKNKVGNKMKYEGNHSGATKTFKEAKEKCYKFLMR
jgi:hypothetical protein